MDLEHDGGQYSPKIIPLVPLGSLQRICREDKRLVGFARFLVKHQINRNLICFDRTIQLTDFVVSPLSTYKPF